jgi:hypothetical protein
MVIKHLKQHLPILEEYPTLHNDFVTMLQRMKNVKQLLTTTIVQLILRGLIESFTLEIILTSHGDSRSQGNGQDNF